MARYHGEVNVDLVVKLVQYYSKTINHDFAYLKSIEYFLKEHGYTTLVHMVVLVKS